MYVNYQLKYQTKGRIIYSPTDECRTYGERLIEECKRRIALPDYHYHYTPGGHVAALHKHIQNQFFFRIDIQRFFYAIRRNRVSDALRHFSIPNPRERAKWSCVANPYSGGGYVLPIGFVQSPMLASLVIMRSPLAKSIERAQKKGAFLSMYFDDFIGSAPDLALLQDVFSDFIASCEAASLPINDAKLVEPSAVATAFNCDLRPGFTAVTDERTAKFYAEPYTPVSAASFEAYRSRVASKNTSPV
jgi:hypothetical protein